MFEHEIVDNKEYLDTYYAPIDRVYNEGWLTLVSPKFAGLGHAVLITIVEHIDIEQIKLRRNECADWARKKFKEEVESHHMPTFLELTRDTGIKEETRKKLFLKIVRKTFNSRVGAMFRYYKSIKINRGTKGENDSALRVEKRLLTGAKAAAKKRKTSA